MTITTTRQMTMLGAAMLAGAVALPGAARAAVIQTGPVSVAFPDDLGFVPASVLPFDPALGTLNGVTVTLSGEIGVFVIAPIGGFPPGPALEVQTEFSLIASLPEYLLRFDQTGVPVSLNIPIVESGGIGRAIGSVPASLEVELGAFGYDELHVGTTFTLPLGVPNPFQSNGTNFTGTVSVTFDYTPAQLVPEPASLVLLGLGLAGLAASRRRV